MMKHLLLILLMIMISTGALCKQSSPKPCPKGEHWVAPHHRRAYARTDGTPVRATDVTGHCRKNPRGYDFWHQKLKTGRPPKWPNRKEKVKKWTTEEIERVLEVLSELPEILWAKTLKGIYRMDKHEEWKPNPASHIKNVVVLYDRVFTEKHNLAYVLAHELAHELYENLDPQTRSNYPRSTGWMEPEVFGKKIVVRDPTKRKKSQFVRPDGTGLPHEDFSNNIEYYLFKPDLLKKITPEAYRWIRKNLGDRLRLKLGGKK